MSEPRLWLLPPGVEELLPPAAARLESLRREQLDLFDSWGYELVTPSLVEHLDALSVGAGADLAMQVFPTTDPLTGRLLGVRADMTTQVARIDARLARTASGDSAGVTRLCYVGSVLRARSDDTSATRNPMQVGAELYGHSGIASDFESIGLMLESLQLAGIEALHLDLGHVGIFRALSNDAGLDGVMRERLYAALQRKAAADIDDCLSSVPESRRERVERLRALARLNGAPGVVDGAREQLAGAPSEALAALEALASLAQMVSDAFPDVEVNIDLAELRGYRYHTGLVFAAFTPGFGREIARGGRYDGVGAMFGESRSATGFSADLRVLAQLGSAGRATTQRQCVLAPPVSCGQPDTALEARVRALRASGVRVVRQLPGTTTAVADGEREIGELFDGPEGWTVRPLAARPPA